MEIDWNKPLQVRIINALERKTNHDWKDAECVEWNGNRPKVYRVTAEKRTWNANYDGIIPGAMCRIIGEVRNKPKITANFTLSEMPTRAKEDFDPIQKPSHYNEGRKYETIDVIEDWSLGYHLSNALKYLSRYNRKGDGIQDLKKAIWYIQRKIKLEEK
jgi:hypothetical protein